VPGRRLLSRVFAHKAALARTKLVHGVVEAALRDVALVAQRHTPLTHLLSMATGAAHPCSTIPLLAAPGALTPTLDALLAQAEHAGVSALTHGVPTTLVSLRHVVPTHAVVLVAELAAPTHAVVGAQTLQNKGYH